MTKFNDGIPTGSRFTSRLVRTDTSAFLDVDINGYGVPPVTGTPNASFTISLIDGCTDVVAPYGAIFRATGFSGFNVSEPAGDTNVYDPTQHKITFFWDFDDAGYTPITVPNIPTAWRNLNVAYGKQVAHVWHTSGTKTVSCYAFDEAGNWGFATLSVVIADPNTFFSGNRTLVFSKASNWTGEPSGATRCTTIAEVHTAMRTRMNAGDRSLRVLTRAGEDFNDEWFFEVTGNPGSGYPGGAGYNYRDNMKGLHLGSFGTGARPIIRRTTQTQLFLNFPDRADCRQLVVSGLDFRGDWNAANETGRVEFVGSMIDAAAFVIYTRCAFDGIEAPSDKRQIRPFIYHDTRITNWANYAIPAFGQIPYCILGCDIFQNVDALNGINQSPMGGQGRTQLGNRHGTFRTAVCRNTIMAASSFFNRAGWSGASDGSGTTFPPTVEQDLRVFTSFEDSDVALVNLGRHHHNWDRCSFEGGFAVLGFGLTTTTATRQSASWTRNVVCDRLLLVPGAGSTETSLSIGVPGFTLRNSYIYRHNVPMQSGTKPPRDIAINYQGTTPLTGLGPVEIYNNTIINDAPTGELAAGFVAISIERTGVDVTLNNNIVRVASRSIDTPAPTAPLGTAPIAGFACRHKGARWNFPPIVVTNVTTRRESSPGVISPGDVAVNEWVNLPYPTYSGNFGSGFTLTQAMITGQATQKHVVSVTGPPLVLMGDSTIWDKADGRVRFDFTSTAIRIQNLSGVTWTSASQIWVLIDNSSRLMPFKSGTSIAGNVLAAPRPLAGSSALSTGNTLPRALSDFFETRKPGSRTNTGTVVPGLASQGAFEP